MLSLKARPIYTCRSKGERDFPPKGVLLFDRQTLLWLYIIDSIVGKGNHSPNHIQRIKPRVEQVCQELGLQYSTEHNAGRIYINLAGGPATMPPQYTSEHGGGYAPGYGGGGGSQYPNQQQQYQQPHQQQYHHQQGQQHGAHQHQQPPNNNHNAEIEAAVKVGTKMLPKILKKLGCCTIM